MEKVPFNALVHVIESIDASIEILCILLGLVYLGIKFSFNLPKAFLKCLLWGRCFVEFRIGILENNMAINTTLSKSKSRG